MIEPVFHAVKYIKSGWVSRYCLDYFHLVLNYSVMPANRTLEQCSTWFQNTPLQCQKHDKIVTDTLMPAMDQEQFNCFLEGFITSL